MHWENDSYENHVRIEVGSGTKSVISSTEKESIRAQRKLAFKKELFEELNN